MNDTKKAEPFATKGTDRKRADLINFVLDATKDSGNYDLANEFLGCSNAVQLQDFFNRHGYCDVPFNDCDDIIEAKKRMKGKGVSKNNKPADCDEVESGVLGY